MTDPNPHADLVRRLFANVTDDPDTGCWIKPANTRQGYAQIMVDGKRKYAHRMAYELFVGRVPTGLELDHLCRIRNCVNPEHLEPVTHAENMARGAQAMKTQCPAGHAYDETNTRVYLGRRYCRTCVAEHSRRRRQRKRAAA